MDDVPWYETLWTKVRNICLCCRPEPAPQPHDTSRVEGNVTDAASTTSGEVSIPIKEATSPVHLEEFILNISSSSFVIRVNLLHP